MKSSLGVSDDLFYGADDIFITSTPEATLAVFKNSLPLSLIAPGPSPDALSALVSVTAEPSDTPDPQLPPAAPATAPEKTTPNPLCPEK